MAHRKIFASLTAAAAMATVLAMPGVAVADTYWHPTNNEAGVKAYPEHFKSSQTRDQVRAEAANAVRDGGDIGCAQEITLLLRAQAREDSSTSY
jgi:hypothetical protein